MSKMGAVSLQTPVSKPSKKIDRKSDIWLTMGLLIIIGIAIPTGAILPLFKISKEVVVVVSFVLGCIWIVFVLCREIFLRRKEKSRWT